MAHTGDYPKQLTAQLTKVQARELRHVNEYREAAGADPVVWDSELAAYACYRSYVDAAQQYNGHDWLYAAGNDAVYTKALRAMGATVYSENAVHHVLRKFKTQQDWAKNYYESKKHYEAMVNPVQAYMGSSHMYVSDIAYEVIGALGYNMTENGFRTANEFDLFTPHLSTALNP